MSDTKTHTEPAELESYLTVGEVAEWLGCNPEWIYDRVADGRIPHVRGARRKSRILIRPQDVRDYLEGAPKGDPCPSSRGTSTAAGRSTTSASSSKGRGTAGASART